MAEEYRAIRVELKNRMNEAKNYTDYKQDLNSHRFVVCTPGDRPDTYRHWETLASGGIPICLDHANFRRLFGRSAVFVDNFQETTLNQAVNVSSSHAPELVSVSYWRDKVNSTRNLD